MLGSKVERLARLLGGVERSELVIGTVPVSTLARQVTTPFYVYSGDLLAGQVQRVCNALGPETALVYSVKANPSVGVCQVIAQQGIWAELASGGELLLAQKAGFPSAKTLFIGPGKTNEELELAIKLRVWAIIVESFGELERVASIASRMGEVVRVGIRANVESQVTGYHMRMGGGRQQFGVDEEQIPELLGLLGEHPNVEVVGLHVYAGSQMFDIQALLTHCHHVVDLGSELADRLRRPLELIDFGGGFGVPYFENSPSFDLPAFAEGYRQVVDRCKQDPGLVTAQLVIELGRYLVAEAGVYVTRVVDVKISRGKRFVVTDGGMNH
ncbi:MAG: alanine racemase, partial [Dehalococcoidia bacterium]